MSEPDLSIGPDLAAALDAYTAFLDSDDDLREQAVNGADPHTLRALVAAVTPLFDEINAVLDRFDVATHPLPAELEQRERDLHSLAQAAIEANMRLDRS